MTSSVLPFAYLAAFTFLVLSAFRCLVIALRSQLRSGDRTGLRTTHPELLDDKGFITKEELLVVRFGDIDSGSLSCNS